MSIRARLPDVCVREVRFGIVRLGGLIASISCHGGNQTSLLVRTLAAISPIVKNFYDNRLAICHNHVWVI